MGAEEQQRPQKRETDNVVDIVMNKTEDQEHEKVIETAAVVETGEKEKIKVHKKQHQEPRFTDVCLRKRLVPGKEPGIKPGPQPQVQQLNHQDQEQDPGLNHGEDQGQDQE